MCRKIPKREWIATNTRSFGILVFVEIEAPNHSQEWRDGFTKAVETMPEIMEVYRMAGRMDYLLRVVVREMVNFDMFYKRLTDAVPIKNVTSHFSMERIRFSTAYPVDTQTR